ncbi:MAG: helix-turn-helix domain-containing protein [Calditrichaceae bacterium]
MENTVKKAKQIIHTQYQEIQSVKEITNTLGCNYHTLRSVFVRETGYTLVSYLNKIRCLYAAIILKTTNKKLYQIAIEVGFNNESYFIKVFKKYQGKCPDEYRRKFSE